MEATAVIQSIIDVGFPIVMCLLMYYSNQRTIEDLNETINNNTIAILRLADKMGVEIDDGK